MPSTFLLSLPVFLLMGFGALLARLGRGSEEGEAVALRLTIDLFMPCFILSQVLGVEELREPGKLLGLVGSGLAISVLQILICLGGAWLVGLRRGQGARTFGVCAGLPNYGYLPIPLMLGLFGAGPALASLLVYNVGVEIAVWSFAISIFGGKFSWKRLVNMPLVALLIALSINLTGSADSLPHWLLEFFRMTGAAAIPVGIVISGMSLVRATRQTQPATKGERQRVLAASLVLRLGLLPLLLLGIALLVQRANWPHLAAVLGVHAAMPAATLPVVLARHYGGQPGTAVLICLSSTAVSLITTPAWLQLAGRWLGW